VVGRVQHLEDFAAQPVVQRVALFRPVRRDAPRGIPPADAGIREEVVWHRRAAAWLI
jgi:hypothetical protein